MTQYEQAKQNLERWKADYRKALKSWDDSACFLLKYRIEVFESALNYFKRPSNTRMHMDTKPCEVCSDGKRNYPGPNFCGFCGRALSQ
jgi:hypothetical protein